MSDRPAHDVTVLLTRVNAGDPSAPGKLLDLVYEDLRHLAAAYMRDERADHTLQATALVHEAFCPWWIGRMSPGSAGPSSSRWPPR